MFLDVNDVLTKSELREIDSHMPTDGKLKYVESKIKEFGIREKVRELAEQVLENKVVIKSEPLFRGKFQEALGIQSSRRLYNSDWLKSAAEIASGEIGYPPGGDPDSIKAKQKKLQEDAMITYTMAREAMNSEERLQKLETVKKDVIAENAQIMGISKLSETLEEYAKTLKQDNPELERWKPITDEDVWVPYVKKSEPQPVPVQVYWACSSPTGCMSGVSQAFVYYTA